MPLESGPFGPAGAGSSGPEARCARKMSLRWSAPLGALAHPDERDPGPFGPADGLVLVEDEGPAGLDGDGRGADLPADVDGVGADAGDVEAHVLLRLGRLHDHDPPAGELS